MKKLGGLVCDRCCVFVAYGTYEDEWIRDISKQGHRMDFCSYKCFHDTRAGRNPKHPRKGNKLRGFLIKLCKKIERFLRRNSR